MKINDEALRNLAASALVWAKAYCALVEALLAQGVTEEDARAEARITAMIAGSSNPEVEESWDSECGGKCPLCGRS